MLNFINVTSVTGSTEPETNASNSGCFGTEKLGHLGFDLDK